MDSRHQNDSLTRLPAGLTVAGDLGAAQDIAIDGRFEGQIAVPDHHVTVGSSAVVKARITARTVTIQGNVDGSVTAAERIDVAATALVRGHLKTPIFALVEGAQFNGTVDPTRTEAAMHVAKYRQKTEK